MLETSVALPTKNLNTTVAIRPLCSPRIGRLSFKGQNALSRFINNDTRLVCAPLPEGSILVQFYCCFPIKRIWNEFGIIGGRGPRIQAGAPEGGPAAGGVPGV
jgi:hypothetical protein